MNVYKVKSNNVAFDEDISMIVIAESKKRALEMAKKEWIFRESRSHNDFMVIDIDVSKEQIVDTSHYGN
ncbi:hypothetical protein [Bacillus thuringiensis]|uniref:hypothetical protein n=1 Tax=Bacillus thuringiensis TaxID=1428 RepID=UPI000BFBF236|nr:hypothetical protein [Bacillus thuringiensis]PGM02689.1 hypothetical protein CN938_30775 [Bacillus thuringiensis]